MTEEIVKKVGSVMRNHFRNLKNTGNLVIKIVIWTLFISKLFLDIIVKNITMKIVIFVSFVYFLNLIGNFFSSSYHLTDLFNTMR